MTEFELPVKSFSRLVEQPSADPISPQEAPLLRSLYPSRTFARLSRLDLRSTQEQTEYDKGKVPHAIRDTLIDKPDWPSLQPCALPMVAKQVEPYDSREVSLISGSTTRFITASWMADTP